MECEHLDDINPFDCEWKQVLLQLEHSIEGFGNEETYSQNVVKKTTSISFGKNIDAMELKVAI